MAAACRHFPANIANKKQLWAFSRPFFSRFSAEVLDSQVKCVESMVESEEFACRCDESSLSLQRYTLFILFC